MCYTVRAIQSAHTPARWRNPSRHGLTTKPLAPHLEGAESPSPTAQKLRIPQSGKESDTQRKINRERERERKTSSVSGIKHTRRLSYIHMSSELTLYNITYLTPMIVNPIFLSTDTQTLLMLSERSISLSSTHEQHSSQAAPGLLCVFILPLCGLNQWTPLLHVIYSAYLSLSETPAVNHSPGDQTQPL